LSKFIRESRFDHLLNILIELSVDPLLIITNSSFEFKFSKIFGSAFSMYCSGDRALYCLESGACSRSPLGAFLELSVLKI